MAELKIELISEKCKECPRLTLETAEYMCQKVHRCKNLQMCREILGFWKEQNRIKELEITEHKEVQE